MKIKVPDAMLKAVEASYENRRGAYSENATRADLEAALRWQSDNPIVPSDEQMDALTNAVPYLDSGNGRIFRFVIDMWQRRMYLAPEPEVPKLSVEDVLNLMLENIDRVQVPIPYNVDPARVPVLKEEAKQQIRNAIKNLKSDPEPEVPKTVKDIHLIDPEKCPHRWQTKDDQETMERIVYCELCDWEYSHEGLAEVHRHGQKGK